MSLESRLTRAALRRPTLTIAFILALVGLCVGIIATRAKLDSDVLNLLPQRFDSVRALKVFDREFSQAREITFAVVDEQKETDIDAFAEYFGDELRKEPWVIRVMDRSPMEMPEGISEVQRLAVPLLMNLPPEAFAQTLTLLEPEQIAQRFARKKAEIEAGSPKAEMELTFDPLGIVVPALKPLAGSFEMDNSRPLGSTDGTLRVVVAVTNQQSLDAEACQQMMAKVDEAVARIRAGWEDGPAPEVIATGRTAYVAEMSAGMKHDVIITVIGSIVLVSGVFYFGYRRLRPLLAIFVVILVCCLVAVATGVVAFESLNMITIGLCAILVGIAVDFGMLLFGAYQAARNRGLDHTEAAADASGRIGRGILFGASTCGAAFLSLLLSESPGFMQLGALIGIGLLVSALFMIVFFFVFTGTAHRPMENDVLLNVTRRYLDRTLASPRPVFFAGAAVLLLLNIYAFLPIGRLHIEANPQSLEPADSRAGLALRTIKSKMAAGVEPVLAILQGRDATDVHRQWAAAQKQWVAAKEKGEIKGLASPAAFALDPARLEANLVPLQTVDFGPIRENFRLALEKEGFDGEAFAGAFHLIDALATLGKGDRTPVEWRKTLPQGSSWLFVLDRFLAPNPLVGVAYITPNQTIGSPAEQVALQQALAAPGLETHLTGWSYVMADLIPWSKAKLTQLSLLMLTLITVILFFIYRSAAPLLILLVSLALSVGALIAGLKLTGLSLNLFNVLGFPLILGIGVDYGIYTILAVRQGGGTEGLAAIIKPIFLSALTAIAGFGALGLAHNPALATLGLLCALGIACCLFATLFFILPAYLWRGYR